MSIQKKVISASRRCDLVAFYPDYLITSLNRFPPEEVHTIVLWSKNPRNLLDYPSLRNKLSEYKNLYLLLSITGLGGTIVERNVPPMDTILSLIPQLMEFIGGAEHIAVRYDPLLEIIDRKNGEMISNIDGDIALKILDKLFDFRVNRIIVSVAQVYKKAVARMAKNNLTFSEGFQQKAEAFLSDFLSLEALKRDIVLDCCTVPNLTPRGCIDGELLSSIHPQKHPAPKTKDRSQRIYCNCTKSIDIGKWFSCPHGCVYCYGNPMIL